MSLLQWKKPFILLREKKSNILQNIPVLSWDRSLLNQHLHGTHQDSCKSTTIVSYSILDNLMLLEPIAWYNCFNQTILSLDKMKRSWNSLYNNKRCHRQYSSINSSSMKTIQFWGKIIIWIMIRSTIQLSAKSLLVFCVQ